MKQILAALILAFAVLVAANVAFAQHHNHAKHNMVLFGGENNGDVFASHIVYKVPHNYQVILKVRFNDETLEGYLRARLNNPDAEFIFLLDHMDISKISEASQISGSVFYRNAAGEKTVLTEKATVSKEHFKIIYFDELPLSLEPAQPLVTKKENCAKIKCI